MALPEYITRVWHTRATRLQIQTTARTSAGIYKINQGDIENIQLPLPSRDEQMRLMSWTGRLEDLAVQSQLAMEKAGRLATRLRQSILKAAFEGKLVPQDRNDEPASVLLGRIRAFRTASRSRARSIR